MRVGQIISCALAVAVLGAVCMAQSSETQGTTQPSVEQQRPDQIEGTTQQSGNPQSMGQNQMDNANLDGQADRKWADRDSSRDSKRRAIEEHEQKVTHELQQQS